VAVVAEVVCPEEVRVIPEVVELEVLVEAVEVVGVGVTVEAADQKVEAVLARQYPQEINEAFLYQLNGTISVASGNCRYKSLTKEEGRSLNFILSGMTTLIFPVFASYLPR
jgi:hypothetical protein